MKKNTKKFAPTRRAQKNMELIAKTPKIKAQEEYLNGQLEYMVIKKSEQTHLLVRFGVYATVAKANRVIRELENKGIAAFWVQKTITDNQYDGYYLLDDGTGNQEWYKGLDDALALLNWREREVYGLRKPRKRTNKKDGVMAFAYDEKLNKFVGTRFYSSEELAEEFIIKKKNIDNNSVIIAKGTKEYDGFHFKDHRLDENTRLKHIKQELLNKMNQQ